MEFLNLTLFQLLGAAGAVAAVVVALYFLDRKRRRVKVSSLRFWTETRSERHPLPQRRIQQPWSLLLVLLGLLALLAALADLRWNANSFRSLDHVLVLDTSSWMQARENGAPLMDRAKQSAIRYLHSLPPGDRVLLVLSDANPVPSGTFEEDLAVLEAAITGATPGNTALQLGEALSFARQMLAERDNAGDIVFVGSRWIAEEQIPGVTRELTNLRVIPIDAQWRNVYIDKVTLQPRERDTGGWTAYVSVGNRGPAATVPVQLSFGSAPVAATTLQVPSDAVVTTPLEFRTGAAGWVDVKLDVADMVRRDNNARVEVPRTGGVHVQVCTKDPKRFTTLFQASPGWIPTYRAESPCSVGADTELLVLDGVTTPTTTNVPTLWIQPPDGTAFPGRSANVSDARVSWNPASPISEGLQAGELALGNASFLTPASNDQVIAEVNGNALALARPGLPPQVAWGFNPLASEMRFEVSTPLLFANTFRWLVSSTSAPEELSVGSAGSVLISGMDDDKGDAPVVLDDSGATVPVSRTADGWQFFAGQGGVYHLRQGHRERVISLTLPQAPKSFWEPTQEQMLTQIAAASGAEPPMHWWPWLAALGLICLIADALLFDRRGQGDADAKPASPFAGITQTVHQLFGREAKKRHGI